MVNPHPAWHPKIAHIHPSINKTSINTQIRLYHIIISIKAPQKHHTHTPQVMIHKTREKILPRKVGINPRAKHVPLPHPQKSVFCYQHAPSPVQQRLKTRKTHDSTHRHSRHRSPPLSPIHRPHVPPRRFRSPSTVTNDILVNAHSRTFDHPTPPPTKLGHTPPPMIRAAINVKEAEPHHTRTPRRLRYHATHPSYPEPGLATPWLRPAHANPSNPLNIQYSQTCTYTHS